MRLWVLGHGYIMEEPFGVSAWQKSRVKLHILSPETVSWIAIFRPSFQSLLFSLQASTWVLIILSINVWAN